MAKWDVGEIIGGLLGAGGAYLQGRRVKRQEEQEEAREKLRMQLLQQRQAFEAEDRKTAEAERIRQMEREATADALRYVGPHTQDQGQFNATILGGGGKGAMQMPPGIPQLPQPLPSNVNVGDFAGPSRGGLLDEAITKRWAPPGQLGMPPTPAGQFGTPPIAPPGGGGFDLQGAIGKAGGFKPRTPEQTPQQLALQQFFLQQSENVERPNEYLPYISQVAGGKDIPETGQPEINAQLPLTTGLPGTMGSTPYRQPGKIGLDQLAGLGGRTKLQVTEDTATAKAKEAAQAKVEAARALSEGRLDVQEAKIFADLLKITDPSTAMSTILQRRQMMGGKAAPEGTPGLSSNLLQGPQADVELKGARAGLAEAQGKAATLRAEAYVSSAKSINDRRDLLAPEERAWLIKRTNVAGAAQALKKDKLDWDKKHQGRLATVAEDAQALAELKHIAQNAVEIGKLQLEKSKIRQAEKAKAGGKATGNLKMTPRQQYLLGRINNMEQHINKVQIETGSTPKGQLKNLMDLTNEFESITKVLEDEEKAAEGTAAAPATPRDAVLKEMEAFEATNDRPPSEAERNAISRLVRQRYGR